MEAIHSAQTSEVALEAIISNVIQIPGVKVDRKKFLADCFRFLYKGIIINHNKNRANLH